MQHNLKCLDVTEVEEIIAAEAADEEIITAEAADEEIKEAKGKDGLKISLPSWMIVVQKGVISMWSNSLGCWRKWILLKITIYLMEKMMERKRWK